jgi:hypothetical protein
MQFPTASVSACRMSKKIVISFPVVAFELHGAALRGVCSQNRSPRARANGGAVFLGSVQQVAEHVVRGIGEQNFAVGLEERFDAVPAVADDRHAAGARFE